MDAVVDGRRTPLLQVGVDGRQRLDHRLFNALNFVLYLGFSLTIGFQRIGTLQSEFVTDLS